MKIIWLPEAEKDLGLITEFISKESVVSAEIVVSKIVLYVRKLANSPGIGRPGRIRGTREFILDDIPYIVPYLVKNSEIMILRVFHQSRKWPDKL